MPERLDAGVPGAEVGAGVVGDGVGDGAAHAAIGADFTGIRAGDVSGDR